MDFIAGSCRICLRPNDKTKPLSSKWKDSTELLEMLISFVDMENTYDASQNICNLCELLLISSYCFKKMCLETEKLLRSHLFYNKTSEINAKAAVDSKEDPLNNSSWPLSGSIWETVEYIESIEILEEPIDNMTEPVKPVEPNSCSNNQTVELKEKSAKARGRTCPSCKIKFADKIEYQIHRNKFHKQTVVCTICGKLKNRKMLKRHMLTHTNVRDHICPKCGKHFKHPEYLKGHLRIHTGEKRFACQYCDRRFRHWVTKRNHILNEHTIITENDKKYECHICDKNFFLSSGLNTHMRVHRIREWKFECNICEHKFNQLGKLKTHMVVHTGEKNVICEICNKAFGTRKNMRSHMKIHTGERNYICVICKKTFTQAQNLRAHMKTHPDYPIPPRGTVLLQKTSKINSNL